MKKIVGRMKELRGLMDQAIISRPTIMVLELDYTSRNSFDVDTLHICCHHKSEAKDLIFVYMCSSSSIPFGRNKTYQHNNSLKFS